MVNTDGGGKIFILDYDIGVTTNPAKQAMLLRLVQIIYNGISTAVVPVQQHSDGTTTTIITNDEIDDRATSSTTITTAIDEENKSATSTTAENESKDYDCEDTAAVAVVVPLLRRFEFVSKDDVDLIFQKFGWVLIDESEKNLENLKPLDVYCAVYCFHNSES